MELTKKAITSCLQYSKDTKLRAFAKTYGNHRLAILLRDAESGEPIATATVNLPEAAMGPDEVAVKDYSENAGMAHQLFLADIIVKEPRRWIQSGFVQIGVYELTKRVQMLMHQEVE